MVKHSDKWLLRNREYHNRIAKDYRYKHTEIYNSIEQERLKNQLAAVVNDLSNEKEHVYALDVGAGAGNVTAHLLDLGCQVVAADVSTGFLEEMEETFAHYKDHLEVALLNGVDLSNWPANTFDLCTTYSVLHHVRDYLALVDEMARVVKPGGIIYIDHESSPQAWHPSQEGSEYIQQIRELRKPSLWQQWGPSGLWSRFKWKWQTLQDPRYQEEGDIHIWPDDHIEWDLIESRLKQANFTSIQRQDYLVCRENSEDAPLYFKYTNSYKDMSLLTAIKINVTANNVEKS